MGEVMYQQCKLRRSGVLMISWIPEQYAKKDKILKIKSGDGWQNGWKVAEVFEKKNTESTVMSLSRSYLHQREVSDI